MIRGGRPAAEEKLTVFLCHGAVEEKNLNE
jgi:hypothetical protein